MESQILTTRAGLTPSLADGLPYRITTDKVQKYLQDKFDVLADSIRRSGGEDYKWKIEVFANEASKKFIPFVAILPDSAVVSNDDFNSDDQDDIFRINNSNRVARLQENFYKLLTAYMYNDDDVRMFRKVDQWRFSMGMTRNSADQVAHMASPRIASFNNGKSKKVIVLLDPLRIFYDMLIIDTDTRKFRIIIDSWKKLDTGRFEFLVTRMLAHERKSNYRKNLIRELDMKMSGGR